MAKKWILKRIPADYRRFSERFGLDPVVIRVLVNRGYDTEESIGKYLSFDDSGFENSDGLIDIDKAKEAVKRFRDEGRKVRIIGDYDIDGVCSTAILLKGLKKYGIVADYAIPHRITDGYGMNANLVEGAKNDGITAIITCDNGISAHDEVELAKSYGIDVVVTDHHDIPEILPDALAVVDPKRSESNYPNTEICGAYVAYKLIAGLLFGDNSEGTLSVEDQDLRNELRILAGFATVGDVMPLNSENKALVKFCLNHIKDGLNTGLTALMDATDLLEKQISSYSIGFVLGPCINATGRIASADNALELLMCEDETRAAEIADLLKEMNEERKQMTEDGRTAASELVKASGSIDDVLVLYLPDIHESIAGIIAGRVKEEFYRPTIVFTDAEEGKIKGSGRSIEAYNMFAHLNECKDLFDKFGGHPMAAGITMPKENLEELRKRLNENANLSEGDLTNTLYIDADMPFSYVTERVVDDLARLEPYGNKNEKPIFARKEVTFTSGKIVGKNANVGIYTVKEANSGSRIFKLKLFRDLDCFHEFLDREFGEGSSAEIYRGKEFTMKVAYYPDLNEFQGVRNVEFVMTDYAKGE